MKHKLKKSLILLSMLTSVVLNAHALQPAKCPDTKAIIAGGLEDVVQMNDGTWAAGKHYDKYSTSDMWAFAIFSIPAKNAAQAKSMAEAAMPTLRYQQGPVSDGLGDYVCVYGTKQGFKAGAVTPPPTLVGIQHKVNKIN
jgi:hypothetical protein